MTSTPSVVSGPPRTTRPRIGIVHPGAMGASVGAALVGTGHRVLWASSGRSAATRRRAEEAGLEDLGTLEAVCEQAAVVLSICPPHAALEVAEAVAATGFDGVYVDANAVAPATATSVLARLDTAIALDGGIVGPPPERPGTTRLYLTGDGLGGPADQAAVELASSFAASPLEVVRLAQPAPADSAVKVAYAAWTKGTTALLLTVRAYARAVGVEDDLVAEWARSLPGLDERCQRSAPGAAAKAWRFAGELREIAAAMETAGLPDGFHLAGAETYERLSPLRDQAEAVDLDAVLQVLTDGWPQ